MRTIGCDVGHHSHFSFVWGYSFRFVLLQHPPVLTGKSFVESGQREPDRDLYDPVVSDWASARVCSGVGCDCHYEGERRAC